MALDSEMLQGWKLAFTVVSSFAKDSRHCCGCLGFYLIEGNNAWKGTVGFISVMSETQKNESPGWKNCLLFFSLISPSMVSGWNLKIYSFKPAVDVLDATWIPHSLAGQTARLACRVWAAVDTGAQLFMNSKLVFWPLPWFIYKISFLFPGSHEALGNWSLTDLE